MVRFNLLKYIENCIGLSYRSFDKVLQEGYLVYSDQTQTYSLNSLTLNTIVNSKIDWFDIVEIDNEYFYVKKNRLFKVNFSDLSVEKIFETKEEALFPYSNNIVSIGSSNWRTKVQSFSIVKLPDKKLLAWEDDRELLFVFSENLALFQDGNRGYLFTIDLNDGKEIWKIALDGGISGRKYFQKVNCDRLIIQKFFSIDNYSLLNIDIITGVVRWEVSNTLTYYNYDDSNNKLYGLGGGTFEVINADTGEREIQQKLSEDLHIASHLTYYCNGLLYFSGYRDKNIPVFGAVNVEDGNLAFTQEVELPGEKSFRKGLDRPVVVRNRLYVRDAMKTLHVYEREDHPA